MNPPRLHLDLPSSFDILDEVVEKTEAFAQRHTSDEDVAYRVVLLASEAVTNALEHGNKLDESKRVAFELWRAEEGFVIEVQDEGDGFDTGAVESPLSQANLLEDHGRGLFLMRELANAMEYSHGGTKVTIRIAA